MQINPTIDVLRELGLTGMASAYEELERQTETRSLDAVPCHTPMNM
ncbi:ATP-binding protein [Mesorhizobium sp. M1423]